MIRLETSRRTGIHNVQEFEISAFHLNWNARIPKDFPDATPRGEMSALYNCHGLTFASRRTRVENTQCLHQILHDDDWKPLEAKEVLPGDIVIYFSEEGEANHSGVIVQCDAPLYLPIVFSKWGNAGEYIHKLTYCPSIYGPVTKFYRCHL
jgi:hypothetical protein